MAQNFSQENLDALVALLGEKLSRNPQNLKENVSKGKVEEVVNGLPPAQRKQLTQLLQDPERARQIIATPQAQMLIKGLLGKK